MRYNQTTARVASLIFTLVLLTACSGGDEVTGTGENAVQGIAAGKNIISNNEVSLQDSSGTTLSTFTDAQGRFQFDVAELKPPYLLRTVTQDGSLYSFSGSGGTANISSLSDVVVRNWYGNSAAAADIDSDFGDPSLSLPDATDMAQLVHALSNLIATLYQAFQLTLGYDFIHQAASSQFTQLLASTTVSMEASTATVSLAITPPNGVSVAILLGFPLSEDLRNDAAVQPTIPQDVAVSSGTSANGKSLILQWNVSGDNVAVASYDIYRGMSIDGPYTDIASSTIAQYVDTDVAADTQYCYQVVAIDNSGQASDPSLPVCATPDSGNPDQGSCPNGASGLQSIALGESLQLTVHQPNLMAEMTFLWEVILKPDNSSYTIDAADINASAFVFVPDVAGDYRFSVSITDPAASNCPTTTETSMVNVVQPPMVNAGMDLSVEVNQLLTVEGFASGDGIQYVEWRLSAGPKGALTGPEGLSASYFGGNVLSYTPEIPGIYQFDFVARWGNDLETSDRFQLSVTEAANAGKPYAIGNENTSMSINEVLILDSSASYDPADANAVLLPLWQFWPSNPGAPVNPTEVVQQTTDTPPQWEFHPPFSGEFILVLNVSNNGVQSYPYYLRITVNP